ncbi:hypothetical protein niasHS_004959 [Heterodera schachtii]|uniref:Fido domain-containing protein n=1 Tax=Heterodera schachtii TaxID=97005 RepID=A0ABD2JQS7_HETSC
MRIFSNGLQRFVSWFNSEVWTTQHMYLFAVNAHFTLSVIHPAEDGNGRLCRLLINLILKLVASRASRSPRIGELNITMFSSGPTLNLLRNKLKTSWKKKKKK